MGFENLTAVEQFGASAAEKLLDTGLQYYSQKNLNEQAQANTQKNMRLASDLALRNQYQSIVNTPMAMRAAGLNPALMNQGVSSIAGVGSPIAGPSGQMGRPNSSTYAENVLAAKQIALLDAEKENLEAKTDKTKADTVETKERTPTHGQDIKESLSRIQLNKRQMAMLEQLSQKYGTEQLFVGQQYKRMLDEDSKATQLIREQYAYRAHQAEQEGDIAARDYWKNLEEQTKELSVGTLYAMRDFSSYVNDLDEYDKQMLARSLQKIVMNMQLSDSTVLYDLSRMPVASFENLIAQTADAFASRDMRMAYAHVGIPSEASYRSQMENTARHNDFVGNIKEGRYSDAAWSLVPDFVHIVEQYLMLRYLKGGNSSPGTFGHGFGSDVPSGSPSTSKVPARVRKLLSRVHGGKIPFDMSPEDKKALEAYYNGEYDY